MQSEAHKKTPAVAAVTAVAAAVVVVVVAAAAAAAAGKYKRKMKMVSCVVCCNAFSRNRETWMTCQVAGNWNMSTVLSHSGRY